MTKEECIALLNRYAEYNGIGIPNLAGCREAMRTAVELLQRPSLPSNLDEAAEAHRRKVFYGDPDYSQLLRETFKSGAEWMAGQGETVEGEIVCAVAHPHENKVMARVYGDYKFGDKVVVQIRKKQ